MAELIVGVIGGMGPDATIELMQRVVSKTPASDDQDHIHMIVDNNPKVPSRIKALLDGKGEDPTPVLVAMGQRLEQAGADFLVMPCNTAHNYWQALNDAVSIPMWNLVSLTLNAVQKELDEKPYKVGLLASPALRKIGLYQTWCDKYDFELLHPKDESKQLEVIRAVKMGDQTDSQVEALNVLAAQLVSAGAQVIVLGCTEFSILYERISSVVPIVDGLEVLANEVVAACTKDS